MEDHTTTPATTETPAVPVRVPWNTGKLVGAKPPLRPIHVWSIRTKLQIEDKIRDLALFNLAIDSKLSGCDVVAIRVAMPLTRPLFVRRRLAGRSSLN